eukprot:2113834-Rhodomonas_salina.2
MSIALPEGGMIYSVSAGGCRFRNGRTDGLHHELLVERERHRKGCETGGGQSIAHFRRATHEHPAQSSLSSTDSE